MGSWVSDVQLSKFKEFKPKKMARRCYRCDICDKSFKLKHDLLKHFACHVNIIKNFQCGECGKEFLRKETLRNHLRVHTGERPFSCDECGKEYRFAHGLHNHLKIHSGIRPYGCKICKKAFTQGTLLSIHMRTHTDERPYQCHQCSKAFHQKSHLNYHLLSHSDRRPHVCEVCGKTFAYKQAFHLHMRIHNNEKPFSCSVCGKQFRENPKLTIHMRVHSGEKPYSCSICSRAFAQKGNRDKHIERYHARDSERKFTCPQCPKAFIWKKCLDFHLEWHLLQEKPSSAGKGKSSQITKNISKTIKQFELQHCLKMEEVPCISSEHIDTKETVKEYQYYSKMQNSSANGENIALCIDKVFSLATNCAALDSSMNEIDLCNFNIPIKKEMEDDYKKPEKKTDSHLLYSKKENCCELQNDFIESVKTLLPLLIDESFLQKLGWPKENIFNIVEEIIRSYDQKPISKASSNVNDIQILRKNIDFLLTLVLAENYSDSERWLGKSSDEIIVDMINSLQRKSL